jgi:hypothetical protein
MGMYTEIYVNVDLKEETPQEIIDILRQLCAGLQPNGFPNRSGNLFNNGSYYTPSTYVHSLTYDEISRQWSFLGKGDLKNYSGEVQHFFDWLMPWVDGFPGDFVGYHRYEQDQKPTLVFYSRNGDDL